MSNRVRFFNTAQSPACSVAAGILTIGPDSNGATSKYDVLDFRGPIKKQAAVAAVKGLDTITVTRANSTYYRVNITTFRQATNNQVQTRTLTYEYTSSSASSANQEIVDALVARINAATGGTGLVAAATAATTFTITTNAQFDFTTDVVGSTGVLAIANTTAYVEPVGVGSYLNAAGFTAASTSDSYVTYSGKLRSVSSDVAGKGTIAPEDFIWYIDNSEAAMIAALDFFNTYRMETLILDDVT